VNEDRYGRRARWPSRIPAAGWQDVARRVLVQVRDDQLPFDCRRGCLLRMLAIFPAIIALVSVYALVADPDQVSAQLAPVVSTLPGAAGDLVVDQLRKATQLGRGGLTLDWCLACWACCGVSPTESWP
jgi:membrane protein